MISDHKRVYTVLLSMSTSGMLSFVSGQTAERPCYPEHNTSNVGLRQQRYADLNTVILGSLAWT